MEILAKKGILTLAVGQKFNKQAKYLAYSCIVHSPSLPRAIITDNPKYFNTLYDITIQYTEDMGDPFNVKLKLQNLSPFFETLFLDSDTLVYTDLRFMWEYFDKQSIVYTGECIKEGVWHHINIAQVLKYYELPWIGKLNSGIFLFRKDDAGIDTLNYAAELHKTHREGSIKVPFFREKMLPDEPFLAISFGKYGQLPTNSLGRLGLSIIDAKNVKLDITKGIARFIKNDALIFPPVVHFAGNHNIHHYFREKIKLSLYYKGISDVTGVFLSCPVYIATCFLTCLHFIKRCIKYVKRIKQSQKRQANRGKQ